jgi:uncharacterized Zn finger protein
MPNDADSQTVVQMFNRACSDQGEDVAALAEVIAALSPRGYLEFAMQVVAEARAREQLRVHMWTMNRELAKLRLFIDAVRVFWKTPQDVRVGWIREIQTHACA